MEFNLAQVHETIASAIPDREAIVWRDRRFSHAQIASRSRRFAQFLNSKGLGASAERETLMGHESGQSHLALYLLNCNEYLESMIGAFKARVAPFNVNYRYVEEELLYLLGNAGCEGIVFHASFAPVIDGIRRKLPGLKVLVQVDDGVGTALLEGAEDYENILASVPDEMPAVTHSPDDLYVLYTGGTTGMPKGVLWRSADVFVAGMMGRRTDGTEFSSYQEIHDSVVNSESEKFLLGPPLMHGAAQWGSFMAMVAGKTLVLPSVNSHFDPHDYLSTVEHERCSTLSIVGDAFATPLNEQLTRHDYDLECVKAIASGGAPLSLRNKQGLLQKIPNILILDSIGSSETGAQASNLSTRDGAITTGNFQPAPSSRVLSYELDRVLDVGDDSLGWLGQSGRMPLGYLNDELKTLKTFPVIEGVRYSVPGDRARFRLDGSIELLGRDSVTINSGGEKVFAEEVEAALKQHPGVYDVVAAGRPSERWGEEIVAIVSVWGYGDVTDEDLIAEASKHVARYKLPKTIVRVSEVRRSPSGKPDYAWARSIAQNGSAVDSRQC